MSGGPVFTAPFSAVALTTNPQDMFFVTANSSSRVALREISFGQYSDAGDAEAEMLSVSILVGTTSLAVGSTITPRNVLRHAGAPTAGTAVSAPSTTLSSTASAVLMYAEAVNVMAGWKYMPAECDQIVLNPGQKAVVRMTAPNDALTVNGTLTFQEIGKVPS
jgi:hypothetical protein